MHSTAARAIVKGLKLVITTGDFSKLHNEKLRDLDPSNIMSVVRSRRMRWVGHVACMGEKKNTCRVLVGKPYGKDHFEDVSLDRRTVLK